MLVPVTLFFMFLGQGGGQPSSTPSKDTTVNAGVGPSNTKAAAPATVEVTAKKPEVTEGFRVDKEFLKFFRNETVIGKYRFPSAPVRWGRVKDRIYAACGKHGLYILDVRNPARPALVTILDKGKNVVDFRVKGDMVVVAAADYQVETYRLGADHQVIPLINVITDPQADRALFSGKVMNKRIGYVTRVTKGWATIRLDPGIKVASGDRVEIRSMRRVDHFSPLDNSVVRRSTKNVVCVAHVSKLSGNHVAIALGRGDAPEVGDYAYFSSRSISGSLWLPERHRDIWRAGVELYPLFSSSSDSASSLFFSALMRATIDYHGIKPFHLQMGIDPLQFLGGSQFDFDRRLGANMFIMAAYEEKQFEIGLGVGYQLPLLHGLSEHNRQGVVLVQMLRLGARDGINLMAKFQSVYSDDNQEKSTRAMVGVFMGEITVPMSKSVNLFTRYMGDGRTLNTFSLGLKTFLMGNGGPGTLIVPVSIGYTSFSPYYEVTDGSATRTEQLEVNGVTFSIGMEQRF